MSDLVKRLRLFEASGPAIPSCQLFGEAADEIERLKAQIALEQEYSEDLCKKGAEQEAEIERLNCALTISRGKHENAIAWNAKLQAVVDAAIEVTQDEQVYENGTTYSLMKMEETIAALEDDDE